MDLSNNLKKMRFNKDQITQEELANKLEVSRQTINAIENGKFNPSVKLALLMADFFECSIEDIFYLDSTKKRKNLI
ncbi:MAG: transcriptional regulator [Candidatus Cloacimonadota bacterium]|nr:MAG: transcriptional regulator [Candidatus Cloacimonadota bacterium]PIE77500.1 MAG: transcriptional regulator [Candidatus Delongbacteria bacterium]